MTRTISVTWSVAKITWRENYVTHMDVDRMLRNAYKPIRFCTLNKLNRDWRNVAKKTSTSLMSTKLIVFGALFAREILRVDSPVSNIIYVPHVRPPRLPWRKCRDIFVGQHMTRHKKKGHSATPALLKNNNSCTSMNCLWALWELLCCYCWPHLVPLLRFS